MVAPRLLAFTNRARPTVRHMHGGSSHPCMTGRSHRSPDRCMWGIVRVVGTVMRNIMTVTNPPPTARSVEERRPPPITTDTHHVGITPCPVQYVRPLPSPCRRASTTCHVTLAVSGSVVGRGWGGSIVPITGRFTQQRHCGAPTHARNMTHCYNRMSPATRMKLSPTNRSTCGHHDMRICHLVRAPGGAFCNGSEIGTVTE